MSRGPDGRLVARGFVALFILVAPLAGIGLIIYGALASELWLLPVGAGLLGIQPGFVAVGAPSPPEPSWTDRYLAKIHEAYLDDVFEQYGVFAIAELEALIEEALAVEYGMARPSRTPDGTPVRWLAPYAPSPTPWRETKPSSASDPFSWGEAYRRLALARRREATDTAALADSVTRIFGVPSLGFYRGDEYPPLPVDSSTE